MYPFTRPEDGQNGAQSSTSQSAVPQATAQRDNSGATTGQSGPDTVQSPHNLPSVSLPKGGGAIKGIGESFSVSPATGTGSFSVPIKTSPGRGGSSVQLSLSYNSGSGNSPFGLGWQISNQSIARKTDKGLPQYRDEDESDVFLLAGTEDLVPVLDVNADGTFGEKKVEFREEGGRWVRVARYQPRIESGFLRILRITDTETGDTHWEVKTDSNVTTIFGDSDNCRVFDPLDPSHVFEWLPSRTYDDKGNETVYEYRPEDSLGIDVDCLSEQHRTVTGRSAARYPKRIKYGNSVSGLDPTFATRNHWLFEVVFDYGDHDDDHPTAQECRSWPSRPDPFSSRRSGFDIRTYRLCRRVLMFHHFPDEPGVGRDCIVASFNIGYESIGQEESTMLSVATIVKSVSQEHWQRDGKGGYKRQSLPPLDFTYSMAQPAKHSRVLNSSSLANLPAGLNDTYELVDLEGQGLPGVVTRIDGSLLYVPNLGNGEFGPAEPLPTNPAAVFRSGGGNERWMDLSGGGKVELVQMGGAVPGFYTRDWDDESGWAGFRPFESFPNLAWDDKNLKFIDVTGDGIADIVILQDQVLTFYTGLGDSGFGGPSHTPPPLEDDSYSGSRLLFWDGVEAIYTADMTGDGLADMVRIRHCEVCYWPNFGYGRFDSKVVMSGAPKFDSPDMFDQAFLRLADVDGSGTTDLIYLGNETPMIYQNLSGNGWSKGIPITGFPGIDATTKVQVIDLLGRGTGCLVWSSVLSGDSGRQIRYLDLMEAGKPYLLVGMDNNMGWETRVTYESSTQFFARDKKAGRPWTSHLPFPVQCVEKTEAVDLVGKNIFTTRYAYHDGYFDGPEREFRGFGMVETWDTEKYSSLEQLDGCYSNISKHSNMPPVLTKTWYHTGEYLNGEAVSRYPDVPYWTETGASASTFETLGSTGLPSSIITKRGSIPYTASHQERREACRALRGSVVRSEVYAVDGTNLQDIPYTVKQANIHLEQRQPLGRNRHAVFFVRPKETLEVVYDRKIYPCGRFDPRIAHTLVLETDFYGNPLRSMTISYGRRLEDPDPRLTDEDRERQRHTYAVLSEATSTNSFDDAETYLLPKPAESRVYEVINIGAACQEHRRGGDGGGLVPFEEALRTATLLSTGKFDVPFENFAGPYPSNTAAHRRLLKNSRAIYRRDDLTGPLPLGVIERLAIPSQNFQLAFTDDQAARYVEAGKIPADRLESVFGDDCNYVRVPGCETGWWAASGEAFFSDDRRAGAAEELRMAREHFFLVRRSRPPFDREDRPAESFYEYDAYDLAVREVRDPYGNRLTVGERDADPERPLVGRGYDYRVLAPFLIMDANRNCAEVVFDVMGNVVASAIRGKPEEDLGDSLKGVKPSLDDAETREFFGNPVEVGKRLLGGATARTVYDFFAYHRTRHHAHPQPNWAAGLTRETTLSDLPAGTDSRVFVSISFSDGSGRSIQTKLQCEPGPLTPLNDEADDPKGDKNPGPAVTNRWLTSSWVILNNKNKPIRQFEPFFSATPTFQSRAIHGVSSTLLYDALARPVAVISPDHAWTKVTFHPWGSDDWDANDTVLEPDPAADPDVGALFRRLPAHDYLPTWHARQQRLGRLHREAAAGAAAASARTPSTSCFDALGRVCVGFEVVRRAGGDEEVVRQPVFLDVQGLPFRMEDALGRTSARSVFAIGGEVIAETSMDGGARWALKDGAGRAILAWNGRGQRFRTEYDRGGRIAGMYLEQGGREYLVERSVYGETEPDGELRNARGRIVRAFDQSGITRTPDYDFRGNVMGSSRQLAEDYKGIIDWAGQPEVQSATYDEKIFYNALGKPTRTILPDGTTTTYSYNERGLVNSVTTAVTGTGTSTEVIRDMEYDAKGQRARVTLGNGVQTQTFYDKETFRISRILTTRHRSRSSSSDTNTNSEDSSTVRPPRLRRRSRTKTEHLQDLRYVYDAAGNLTHVSDAARQATFFRNQRVGADQSFVYDSIYRLVEATGREHVGQTQTQTHDGGHHIPSPSPGGRADHANDAKAVGRYVERYVYDAANNLVSVRHTSPAGGGGGWTRRYEYCEASPVEAGEVGNRLSRTRVGGVVEEYRYDAPEAETGNMTGMPGLPGMEYDYGERMALSVQTVGRGGEARERTYYRYDATGQRVRKVTERCGGGDDQPREPAIVKETVYIGGAFEVFRRYGGSGNVSLEVHSLSVAESGRRLLLIENRTVGGDSRAPGVLYRYQLGNNQGSATVEVDEDANLISYEEYTPYGVSSLRAVYRDTEIPKRYRFLGKERDDTGLYHFGARYYAAWLGRFVSADPDGAADGPNLYQYSHGNPVMLADPGGKAAGPAAAAPAEALGWGVGAMTQRARDWVVFENLPSWVSGLREWRVYGRLASTDFAMMLQNQLLAGGATVGEAAAKFEQYMPSAETGGRLGSSFIDFMFPGMKRAFEHKLMDFAKYAAEDGSLAEGLVEQAFQGADGILAQLSKHSANVAAELGKDWGKTQLAVTIRGVEEGSTGWNAMTSKIQGVLQEAGQVEALIVHADNPALVAARRSLDAGAMALINKAGGLAKVLGSGAKYLGPLSFGLAVVAAPFQAYAATDTTRKVSDRVQSGLDLGSGLTGLGVTAVAGAVKAGTLTGAATVAGATATVVAGAALGGAAVGAGVGGYVADKVENSQWVQGHLGKQGAAAAGAGTGVLAGAAAGAAVGALVGSVLPVVGTAAGAAIGAVAGAVGASAKILIRKWWG